MSIMVGVGRGAGLGVLIKNAEALERMEKVDTLVVDKTGTLTEGKPSRHPDRARRRVRRPTRSCGSPPRSNAPRSTRWPAPSSPPPNGRASTFPDVTDFDAPAGRAPSAASRATGSSSAAPLPDRQGVDTEPAGRAADELRADGATAILVGVDGTAAGIFAIADPVKDTTAEALAALRAEGIEVVMLTGDNRVTAEAVGAPPGHRPGRGRGAARPQERRRHAAARARAGSWRWPATASTTHPPWRPPTSAWRWAQAPTWPSRAPASPCSAAT